jgi:hypothetical protein
VVFRDEPFWEGGVLQTIGLGIILALPPMLLLHRRGSRTVLVALALGAYALFSVSYAEVTAWLWAHGTPPHLSLAFKRDFLVNNHWISRGVTNFLCLGSVFCLLGLAYYVVEVRRVPVGWLVVLGRTSLMLYFLHHVLVLTISHEWLGLKLDNWWWYALANVLLTIVLVCLGRLWLEVRSVAARRLQTA